MWHVSDGGLVGWRYVWWHHRCFDFGLHGGWLHSQGGASALTSVRGVLAPKSWRTWASLLEQ